ncbi:2-amino-4-hydroxy-6-hydroxymethyldihydropteridine diphosphokinase [Marinilabiliaceae bacterium ANBcel2]|nr:2-amino-4-hydroxy-6-hydroxymethyldihydropteridine diphosphokinase [Marinilabiliaceae bacterium ANBcel2]
MYLSNETVIILLGGNMPNSLETINKTVIKAETDNIFKLKKSSSLWESEPWGFNCSNNFINQIVEVKTKHSPTQLLEKLLKLEKTMGREKIKSSKRYSSRVIDIDILFYEDRIISSELLQIPHPRLHLRRFTLEPLQEKWGDLIHPKLNISVKEILKGCKDKGFVKKIN